jgi:flagellar biosynthesis activator protein FlaF
MLSLRQASNAYAASASHRSLREQEAEVFKRTNAVLRRAMQRGGVARVRALADNQLLWSTVTTLLVDPDNALPAELRAAIVSVAMAVQREMRASEPDFEFLLTINQNMADGLSGIS